MFFFSLVDHPHPIRHEIWQEKRNFPFPSLLYYSQLKALFTPNWQLEDGSIAPLKMTKKCSKGCAVCVYNVSDFELYYSRKKKNWIRFVPERWNQAHGFDRIKFYSMSENDYLLTAENMSLSRHLWEAKKKNPKNSSTRWQQMALKLKLKIELLKKIFVCFFSSIPVSLSVCCNISVWWCCLFFFLQCKMCTVALI